MRLGVVTILWLPAPRGPEQLHEPRLSAKLVYRVPGSWVMKGSAASLARRHALTPADLNLLRPALMSSLTFDHGLGRGLITTCGLEPIDVCGTLGGPHPDHYLRHACHSIRCPASLTDLRSNPSSSSPLPLSLLYTFHAFRSPSLVLTIAKSLLPLSAK